MYLTIGSQLDLISNARLRFEVYKPSVIVDLVTVARSVHDIQPESDAILLDD